MRTSSRTRAPSVGRRPSDALLADDTVFLRRTPAGVDVAGFPDEVDVTPDTLAWFPGMAPWVDAPGGGRAKRTVRVGDGVGAAVAAAGRPAAVVILDSAHPRHSELSALGPDDALVELAPNVALTDPDSSQAHFNALGALVREAPCWRLAAGRDFSRLARLLERTS